MFRYMLRLAFIGLALISIQSNAKDSSSEPSVYCNAQTNTFFIWLSFGDLDSSLFDLLKANSQSSSDECFFKDGSKLTMEVKEGQSFGYGSHGANPAKTFTLYYKGIPLYYDATFYDGSYYGSHTYVLEAVVFDGKRLLACARKFVDEDDMYQTKKKLSLKDCVDVSVRLKGHESGYTDEEKNALKNSQLTASMNNTLSPRCQQFIKMNMNKFGDAWGNEEFKDVDLANDGHISQVYSVENENHFFSGSYLVAIPKVIAKDFSAEAISDAIGDRNDDNVGLMTLKLKKIQGEIISAKIKDLSYGSELGWISPRYVYNDLVRYENKNYIISRPHNEKVIPSLVLSQVLPDRSLKAVCVYP